MLTGKIAPFALVLICSMSLTAHAGKAFLLNGIDTKVDFSTPGKIQFVEPGTDLVNIMDISDPAHPRTANPAYRTHQPGCPAGPA